MTQPSPVTIRKPDEGRTIGIVGDKLIEAASRYGIKFILPREDVYPHG